MAEAGQARNPLKGQNLENILGILGQALDVGGKFVFGPNANLDFGAPVKMAAGLLQQKREQKNLMDTLGQLTGELPEIAPMLQQAQGVMDQGGLMNVLGQAGQPSPQADAGMQQASSGQSPVNVIPGQETVLNQLGAEPSPMAATQLSPSLPPAQTQVAPVDLSSDETLLQLAKGAPHLAEKLLTSRVASGGGKGDPIRDMMAMLALQNYETPEQKRQAELAIRQQVAAEQDKNQRERQAEQTERQARAQAEKITPQESKSLEEIDGLLAGLNTIQQDISAGTSSSLVLGNIARRLGPTGERIVQAVAPEKALAFKNLGEQAALFQKAISGAAVSEPEAQRLAVTRPQATDSPQVQQALVDNLRRKTNELKLIRIANIAQRMEQSGGAYRGPLAKEAQLYRLIRDPMNKNFKETLANKDIQAIRKELGIDYGYNPPTKK